MSKANVSKKADPVALGRTRPRSAPGGAPSNAPWEARIFVRDLVLPCRIGIHQHERVADQRIRINLDLDFRTEGPLEDDLDSVVCYSELVTSIRHVVGAGHVNLAETLAERIATTCLEDARVRSVRVKIEKLEVFPEAESVGVEIERKRPQD